jgi:membrane-bound lytic murein transglycosylase B
MERPGDRTSIPVASVERRAPSVEAVSRSLRPILRGYAGRHRGAAPRPHRRSRVPALDRGFPNNAPWPGHLGDTFDRAFAGVQLQRRMVERDRNQAEFSRTLWDYLDSAVSDTRIANGRAAVAEHRDTLERIERQYRVEAEVVAAIWGLESAYGAQRGSTDIIVGHGDAGL